MILPDDDDGDFAVMMNASPAGAKGATPKAKGKALKKAAAKQQKSAARLAKATMKKPSASPCCVFSGLPSVAKELTPAGQDLKDKILNWPGQCGAW
jgi:hypothetical protein